MNELKVRLVKADDYYRELVDRIPKAQKRVVIHAMNLAWAPRTEEILSLLHEALKNKVEVRIVGDYYSKFFVNRPRFVRPTQAPKWAYTSAANYKLEAAGAHITYIGKVGLNPFKGRCHTKITIIDDRVYTFGGINFTPDAFDNIDYMLTFHDTTLASELYDLVLRIANYQVTQDITAQISEHNTMLVDSGKPNQSIIYETTCKLVAQAKTLYFVSQFCPSGRLAEYITKTDNYCYFNRPANVEVPANFSNFVDQTRYHITNRYKGQQYIHAKFVLTEDQDGTKHVITGSNNFSWRGVAYGTKEIALHSTDPALWEILRTYMGTITKPTNPVAK